VVTPEGQLQNVTATFRPATNDTVIDGRPFREVHSPQQPQYAAGQTWFVQDAPIRVMNREYVKFGVTRLFEAGQLTRAATYQGVPVFTEAGAATPPQVIYVPVRPGCEMQPYQLRTAIRPRG
jgi:hypothetical protein